MRHWTEQWLPCSWHSSLNLNHLQQRLLQLIYAVRALPGSCPLLLPQPLLPLPVPLLLLALALVQPLQPPLAERAATPPHQVQRQHHRQADNTACVGGARGRDPDQMGDARTATIATDKSPIALSNILPTQLSLLPNHPAPLTETGPSWP